MANKSFVRSVLIYRVLFRWLARTTSLGANVSMDWLLVLLLTTNRVRFSPNGMYKCLVS